MKCGIELSDKGLADTNEKLGEGNDVLSTDKGIEEESSGISILSHEKKMRGREITARAIASVVVEKNVKMRCLSVSDGLTKCNLSPQFPKSTLLRLIHSELNLLHQMSSTANSSPLNFNIQYLEAVVHILQKPFITGGSHVCRPVGLSPPSNIMLTFFVL